MLGRVNLLEHTFEPADSGLFHALVFAAEEHRRKSGESGVHIVCLDDIDLGAAEHYLSGLVQQIQLPEPLRVLRCFDPHSVRNSDPLQRWGHLLLAPSLRLVGTMADVSRASMSARLLDSATSVRLYATRARELHAIPDQIPSRGAPVSMAPMRAGFMMHRCRARRQSGSTGSSPPSPISARRSARVAIAVCAGSWQVHRRSAVPILRFDLQLADRVRARSRSVFGSALVHAADAVLDLLEASAERFPETLRALEGLTSTDGDEDF